MSSTKLVTVYGATGQQGGSVINSLLENKSGEFAIRAITRNPQSDKSTALASRGVEVVKGDGFRKDQMEAAFKGSWAAFVNTNSSDPVSSALFRIHIGVVWLMNSIAIPRIWWYD